MTKHKHFSQKKGFIYFIVTGIISTLWLLLRVIPKPHRITYPCQRVAAANAMAFLTWLAGSLLTLKIFKKAGRSIKTSKIPVAAFLYILAFIVGLSTILITSYSDIKASIQRETLAFNPDDPNQPVGEAKGINPGRVVWAFNPDAVSYDPETSNGFWWDDNNTNPEKVDEMFTDGIDGLSGATRTDDSWDAFFRYANIRMGKGDFGYAPGEKIAIKANLLMGLAGGKEKYNRAGPTPQLLNAILEDLITEVGIPGNKITVYDVSARIPDYIMTPFREHENEEFHSVNFVGNPGYIENDRYLPAREDLNEKIHFADTSVSDIYLVKSITESDYLINLTNLKTHNMAGVTLCAKNLYGSVYIPSATDSYTFGFGPYNKDNHSGLHKCAAVHDFEDGNVGFFPAREMGSYNYLVDIMGHPEIYNKTILYIVDGLYGASPQNKIVKFRNFKNKFTASIFISQDPIALESVCLDFLRTEPNCAKYVYGNVDNYLHEAALAGNPPSGMTYNPGAKENPLSSLGVHEHWNNANDKQYTRNLESGNGVELYSLNYESTGINDSDTFPELHTSCYPNPFSSDITIAYTVVNPDDICISILGSGGQVIETLRDTHHEPGKYTLKWTPENTAPGIYYCRIISSKGSKSIRKLIRQ